MSSKIIGTTVLVKTDYMREPMVGTIKRVRIEVETKDGKQTLVSLNKIKEIKILEDK